MAVKRIHNRVDGTEIEVVTFVCGPIDDVFLSLGIEEPVRTLEFEENFLGAQLIVVSRE